MITAANGQLINLGTQVQGVLSQEHGGCGNTAGCSGAGGSVNLQTQITNVGTVGKVPISDGTNLIPGDPIVSGTAAVGATPVANPVWVAGSDGSLIRSLTTDTNGYLKVLIQNSSFAVTGTFWQSVQPISGSVSVSNFPASQAVTGTFWQSIQPVSGTVTVNTISGFALETGGNLGSIKTNTDKIPSLGQALAAASVPIVLTAAQLTTLTPPAALTNFANETGGNLAAIKADVDKIPALGQALAAASTPVVLPATQITALTPPTSVTVTQGTGSNLHAVLDASTAVIGHVVNDASSAVIGHVIVDTAPSTAVTNSGTFATQATLSAETTKAIGVVRTADGAGNLLTSTGSALDVNIKSNSVANANPCLSGFATIQGVSGTTSGTAAVQVIALSGTTKIYVCSLVTTAVSGTTPTIAWKYGTGSACATGGQNIVGPSASLAAGTLFPTPPFQAVTPAGQELCYVQTGTTPIMNYTITYVQQ